MKSLLPRRFATLIASLAASAAILTGFAFYFFKISEALLLLAALSIVVFVIVFQLVYQTLRNFIFEKIKPLYNTLYNFNTSDEQLNHDINQKDILNNLQTEVQKLSINKTNEISQLRQLEKYRREFLGNVSHELKTPIFNIQGYVLTLLDGGLEDESINRLYLERTEKSINRLISIVNDLESISRLESGELKLEYGRFNLVKLVEEVFEEHERLTIERSISLKFDRNQEKPIYVIADKKRILEVLNNLIINSIKYGKNKGQTKVSFLDMDDHIMIEISDNGIGISDKDLPRIFERFYRTDKSRSRAMGGTGLGLSIVKHIIEGHNQSITVRSQPNIGTSFTFTLKKG